LDLPFSRSLCLALTLMGAALPLHAQTTCERDDWGTPKVCLRQVNTAQGLMLYVQNFKYYPITLGFTLNLENLAADQAAPLIYPPRSETRAFSLQRSNANQPWRWNYQYRWQEGSSAAKPDLQYHYHLPYRGTHRLIQGFNGSFSHFGAEQYCLDWEMPEGTEVRAAREGIVVETEDRYSAGGPDPNRYKANFVTLQQPDGSLGYYLHLKPQGVLVQVGQKITAGTLLGWSGNTGFTTGPHLHFCVQKPQSPEVRISLPISFDTRQGQQIFLEQGKVYSSLD
jgi:murein DD-endopeptidase MepM/ murein hydrolase activator NlpD